MEFCPKCGTRLTPKGKKQENRVGLHLICPKCGLKKRAVKMPVPSIIKRVPQESIAVIGKRDQKLRTLPTVRITCPKCENNLASVWQVQTRGSDESSTQFFRCTKCNYTFREYG